MFPKRSKRRGTHCLFESEHESNEKVVNYLERRVYQTKNRRLWELLLQICATSRLRQSLVLFVVQRLDWIETRRAYGRDHAADQSHQSKDCGRNCYAGWRNNQANVASQRNSFNRNPCSGGIGQRHDPGHTRVASRSNRGVALRIGLGTGASEMSHKFATAAPINDDSWFGRPFSQDNSQPFHLTRVLIQTDNEYLSASIFLGTFISPREPLST